MINLPISMILVKMRSSLPIWMILVEMSISLPIWMIHLWEPAIPIFALLKSQFSSMEYSQTCYFSGHPMSFWNEPNWVEGVVKVEVEGNAPHHDEPQGEFHHLQEQSAGWAVQAVVDLSGYRATSATEVGILKIGSDRLLRCTMV